METDVTRAAGAFAFPDWALGLGLLLAAGLAAYALHALLVRVGHRLGSGQEFLRLFLARSERPIQLALVLFSLAVALQFAPLAGETRDMIEHGLLLALIVLIGLSAGSAVGLGADLYMRRFRLDTEDNLLARKHLTQVRILKRAAHTLLAVVTVAAALTSFESVRQFGVSLFASAGAAGLIVGLAARPVLSNLIAGVQIALTQPIRIEDAVTVEGEFGWIEEIGSAFVVVRLWDLRRLIVPLSHFVEKPFQNWTREPSGLIGAVLFHVDYAAPVDKVRAKVEELVKASPLWDGKTCNLQVVEATRGPVELRALVSARTAGQLFDLRCHVREQVLAFLQAEHPQALPRQRTESVGEAAPLAGRSPPKQPRRSAPAPGSS